MAYDLRLADRIRDCLLPVAGVTERKMFGGIAFMVNGNMCCGVIQDLLLLRLGNEGSAQALEEKHTRLMDFTGQKIKSMVFVGVDLERAFCAWRESQETCYILIKLDRRQTSSEELERALAGLKGVTIGRA